MPYTSKYPEIESSVLALERESVGMTAPFSQDELMLVLQYHCGECHFPSPCGTSDCGLQYMDDMAKLVETGKVIPGDGEASRLVLRMRRGEMPPLRSAVPPVPPASRVTLMGRSVAEAQAAASIGFTSVMSRSIVSASYGEGKPKMR